MKRIISVLLVITLIAPVFANDLSIDEVTTAVDAIVDTSYVAASQFLTFSNSSDIPSIAIRVPEGKYLPDAVVVNEGDMSSYLKYFPENSDSSSLLSPMRSTVREQLIQDNWVKGQAIVTGVAAVVFQQDQSIMSLISGALGGIFPKVGMVTNYTVEGEAFSEPAVVKGTFIISAESDGTLQIDVISLNINDKSYNIE